MRGLLLGIGLAMRCGSDCREYTSFAGGVDLIADSPDGKSAASQIVVLDSGASTGVLEIVTAIGATRQLSGHLLVGRPLTCGVRAIGAATDAAKVLVIWP